jgi:PAS domain S-box-containing protein
MGGMGLEKIWQENELGFTVPTDEAMRAMEFALHHASEGIFWVNESGRFVYANAAASRILGYSPQEFLTLRVMDVDLSVSMESWSQQWQAVKEKGFVRYEAVNRAKDGRLFPVEVAAYAFTYQDKEYHCAFIHDITERKRAEDAQKTSEAKYRRLYESIRDAVVGVDLTGRITEFNEVYRTMLGYEEEELRSMTYQDLTPAKWHPIEAEIMETQVLPRGYSDLFEKEYRRKDGTVFPVELQVILLRDDAGTPEGMWAIVRNITDRKQAEEKMQVFQTCVENATINIMWLQEPGTIVYANKAACRALGYTREELLTKTIPDIDPECSVKEFANRWRILREAKAFHGEVVHQKKDGTIYPVEVSTYLFTFGGREYGGSFAQDISDRKRAEDALKASEAKYRRLHETMRDAFVGVDLTGRIMEFNDIFRDMLGYEPQELLTMTYHNLTPAKWHPIEAEIVETQLFSRGYTDVFEKEYRRKDGTVFPVELRAILIRDETGAPLSMWAVVRDITDRKQAEEKMQVFQTCVENATVDIIWTQEPGTMVYANQAACRSLGYTREELLKLTVPDIDPDCPMERFTGLFKLLRETKGTHFETRHRRKDGTIFPVEISTYLFTFGGQDYSGTFTRDISERKHAEEEMRVFQTCIDNAAISIMWLDEPGKIVYVNQAACRSLGYTREELLTMTLPDIDPDYSMEQLADLWKLETKVLNHETRHRRKDGTIFPVEVNGYLFTYAGREIAGTFIRDISDRKKAEEAMQVFQTCVENATIDIIWTQQPGTMVYANQAACRSLGYTREELLKMTIPDINPDCTPEQHSGEIWKTLQETKGLHFEARHRRKDGSIFPVEINTYLFTFGGQEYSGTFTRDISERKQAEAEMKQARDNLELRVQERTAELIRSNTELARFAYVASHDLQEPLRMVASYCQLLDMRYRDKMDDEGREFLAYAVEGAVRMQALIRGLLEYSQISTSGNPFEPVDSEAVLSHVLQRMEDLIAQAGARVTHDPLPVVRADKKQWFRVFQCLVENALKFRKAGITPQIHIAARRTDGEWLFSVRDNGIGIEPEYFDRVFVIFQRLHSREKFPGTGIGLALAHRIIERHKGKIWVESTPGQQTTVYFTIPA